MLVSFRIKRERLTRFNCTYKIDFSTAVILKGGFTLTDSIPRAAKVVTLPHAILVNVEVNWLKRLIS